MKPRKRVVSQELLERRAAFARKQAFLAAHKRISACCGAILPRQLLAHYTSIPWSRVQILEPLPLPPGFAYYPNNEMHCICDKCRLDMAHSWTDLDCLGCLRVLVRSECKRTVLSLQQLCVLALPSYGDIVDQDVRKRILAVLYNVFRRSREEHHLDFIEMFPHGVRLLYQRI